ncbi:MAG TPA: hypothetical protein PK919_07495 [Candidatus Aminicenantes bacterium]|nr:hypothetical protein [Candidatus Aminicenantes bacterium]
MPDPAPRAILWGKEKRGGSPRTIMRLRFDAWTIPVSLAGLGLWAILGAWYVAIAPPGASGADNIGIVLSTFGACLFIADRLAGRWLRHDRWLLFLKLRTWGLLFIAWGLVEWLRAFQSRFWVLFACHWGATVLTLAVFAWVGRKRHAGYSWKEPLEETGPISLR